MQALSRVTVPDPPIGTGLATTGTITLDLSTLDALQWIVLSGNPTFAVSNGAAGRSITLRLDSGGSARTLAWPSGWKWLTVAPTTLPSGKTMVVSVTYFDTTDANAIATYALQP